MHQDSPVAPVTELNFYGIQGSNPEPFRTVEIKWSRKEAEAANENMNYIPPTGRAKLLQFLHEYCPMRRSTVVFAAPKESDPSGAEVAGSGICVRSGDAFGVLTARHVLVDPSGKLRHQSGLLIRFFDDRCVTSKGFAVPVHRGGLYYPVTRTIEQAVWPGLPDIGILRIDQPAMSTYLAKIHEEDSTADNGNPRWLDLRELAADAISGSPQGLDEILKGSWFVTGAISERSGPGFTYVQITDVFVDRVYERGGYQYLGLFHGGQDRPSAENQNYGGTSGGPLWQQRLSERSIHKLCQNSGGPLTPDDLLSPHLGAVVFYQDRRGRTDSNGKERAEIYGQRLDATLLTTLAEQLIKLKI